MYSSFFLALHVPGSLNFLYNSWIIVAIFPFRHHTRICKTFCKLVKSNAISCMMNAHLLYLVHIPVHVLLHVYVLVARYSHKFPSHFLV